VLFPAVRTPQRDALSMDVADSSFGVVLVQDGLHHLANPVDGLTEMLRVAKKAVVVIEPHEGLVAKAFGRTWEWTGDAPNFVLRWNRWLMNQVVRSYLLQSPVELRFRRVWDHAEVMGRVVLAMGGRVLGVRLARLLYSILDSVVPWGGNMMICVIVKQSETS